MTQTYFRVSVSLPSLGVSSRLTAVPPLGRRFFHSGAKMPDLTYGGRAVGLTFNPSGDNRVNRIKQLYAEIIDELVGPSGPGNLDVSEKNALAMIAVRQAQSAQMWAVKAVTWSDGDVPAGPGEPSQSQAPSEDLYQA